MATFIRALGAFAFIAAFFPASLSAETTTYNIDFVHVTVEKRPQRNWLALDTQVTAIIPLPAAEVFAVIEDFATYPQRFTHIKEAVATPTADGVDLTETVVVEALGIRNVNRFSLKMVRSETENPHTLTQTWNQIWSDGTIDSVSGSWVLVDVGTAEHPKTRVVYRSRSSVPETIFGQYAFIQLFLGGETKAVVEAVAKAAGAR